VFKEIFLTTWNEPHSNQRTCRISRSAALSTEKRASAKVIIQCDHPRTDSSCTRELMTLFCDFGFYFIRYVNGTVSCFVSSSPNITSPTANILRIYKEENKWNLHIHERTLYLVGKYERERERDQQIYVAPCWLYRCIP